MTSLSNSFDNYTQEVLSSVYRRGDRYMSWLIGFHAVLSLYLASFYDTWLVSLSVAALAIALFFGSRALVPATRFTRVIAGITLQIFVILHIYQLHGLAEMHFFYFTAVSAMVFYQDWKAIVPGVAVLVAQHTAFAVFTNMGVQLYFFEESYIGFTKLAFHFGVAVLQAVLAGTIANYLYRRTLEQAETARNLAIKQEETQQANEQLEQTIAQRTWQLQDALAEANAKQKESEAQNVRLLTVQAQMQQQQNELEAKREELEAKRLEESRIAHFSEILRWDEADTLSRWGDRFLDELAREIDALQACLFIRDDREGNAWLRPIAGYAAEEQYLNHSIRFGVGLTGQAAHSNQPLFLDGFTQNGPSDTGNSLQAPANSTLARVQAQGLAIYPLAHNGKVEGVLELTFLTAPSPATLSFFQRLAGTLAAHIVTVRSQQELLRLYAETRERAEMLAAQEEELRQNLEELHATQEEMRRIQLDLETRMRQNDLPELSLGQIVASDMLAHPAPGNTARPDTLAPPEPALA